LKPDQFIPELLDRMQQAFDQVSDRLKLGPDNPLRSKLATVLIELATEGESENLMTRALPRSVKARQIMSSSVESTTGSDQSSSPHRPIHYAARLAGFIFELGQNGATERFVGSL
jgi:hypothetical protein